MSADAQILERMIDALIDHDVDLGDERAVIMLLLSLGFGAKAITRNLSAAVDAARTYWASDHTLRVAVLDELFSRPIPSEKRPREHRAKVLIDWHLRSSFNETVESLPELVRGL